jgi:hypothetical protein
MSRGFFNDADDYLNDMRRRNAFGVAYEQQQQQPHPFNRRRLNPAPAQSQESSGTAPRVFRFVAQGNASQTAMDELPNARFEAMNTNVLLLTARCEGGMQVLRTVLTQLLSEYRAACVLRVAAELSPAFARAVFSYAKLEHDMALLTVLSQAGVLDEHEVNHCFVVNTTAADLHYLLRIAPRFTATPLFTASRIWLLMHRTVRGSEPTQALYAVADALLRAVDSSPLAISRFRVDNSQSAPLIADTFLFRALLSSDVKALMWFMERRAFHRNYTLVDGTSLLRYAIIHAAPIFSEHFAKDANRLLCYMAPDSATVATLMTLKQITKEALAILNRYCVARVADEALFSIVGT